MPCHSFGEDSRLALRFNSRRTKLQIQGNTIGLSPSDFRTLERLFRRRVAPEQIVSAELAKNLAEASASTDRQVAVLVNRAGHVEAVIVGDATKIMLPDLGRHRASGDRLRGLRLIHTHLRSEKLTRDDLVDLSRLRLDLVCAILLQPDGAVGDFHYAHVIPENPSGQLWFEHGPMSFADCLQQNAIGLFRSLEEQFARVRKARPVQSREGRAVLIHVTDKKHAHQMQSSLRELHELARSAGVVVADEMTQVREQLDPRFVMGRGKLDDVVLRAMQLDAELLIFDRDLTAAQASSISAVTELKVIDRTQLILDIFAQRAESRDGKLQVELAQLKYMLPRLGQRDDSLSRLTGGIGGRGPGETKLEIASRRARDRVTQLEKQLKDLGQQRKQRRARRVRARVPTVALIGYTNAGKSTLLNALTGADVYRADKLFATLDPRSRRLDLAEFRSKSDSGVRFMREQVELDADPDSLLAAGLAEPIVSRVSREVIVTDTVGFIRDLPRELLAAFRATFEEAADADLLLHVVDASDENYEAHIECTEKLLEELELSHLPRLLVFNKSDCVPPNVVSALARSTDGVAVSSLKPETLTPLLHRMEHQLFESPPRARRPLIDSWSRRTG